MLREYKTTMVRISDLAEEPYWLNIQAQEGWIIRDTVPVPDSLYKNRIIVIWVGGRRRRQRRKRPPKQYADEETEGVES